MKKYLLYLTTAFLTTHFAAAQVLYTEDFDSLTVGNVGTDITGTIPGQAGWYTVGGVAVSATTNITANADFRIASEIGRGNVLIVEGSANDAASWPIISRCFFRTDIDTYWNQRVAGNDIFKFSYDFYTGAASPAISTFLYERMILYNIYGMYICSFHFDERTGGLGFHQADSPNSNPQSYGSIPNYGYLFLPEHSWVTLEVFIDYTNQKFYISIPSFNLTVASDFLFPMALENPVNEEDPVNGIPGKIEFCSTNANRNFFHTVKYDNINISATNTAPTVSVKDFISEKFNVFPNPVADIVTITNSENIGINEVIVYDVTGKKIKTKKYSNENNIQLNLADIATGVYLLHIQTKERVAVKKIIKQ